MAECELTEGGCDFMEVDINGIGYKISGIVWRIKNEIIDKLRELHKPYDCRDNDDLEQLEKDLADEVEELDFIGDILANGAYEEEKQLYVKP